MAKHTMGQLRAERDISEMFDRDCPLLHSDAFCLMIPATTGHDANKQWANVQFIALACNAHDDLLEALKSMIHRFGHLAIDSGKREAAEAGLAAIAKAEGKGVGS